ncbi:tyrosine-type recombinase/integrase [Nitrospira defluvii]|uniref:Phage_integrase domain-containing protein n=1 Tax=Nitrospira defluvii TaxID=330214 RepID=A0ABN7M4U7_9BACT|nr:tyrosine-type recombinase/integrase [Nitrospira defluvii]CAE6779676.1 Phage_integrase domain-containing protein [Nitrospira defluvii]
MRHTKSKHVRGGQIENIGHKRQLITWNQGRRGRNIRLKVSGTRETAEKILQKIREEFYSQTHGIRIEKETTIADLVALVVDDYAANAHKDQRGAKYLHSFWSTFAPSRRADEIDADQLSVWAKEWRQGGLSPGRTNRRMSFLLRGYRIAHERGLVNDIPKWTDLKESPPRSGTRSWQEFIKVRGLLPAHVVVPVTIEYWLGTRSGETLTLEWTQVRFHHNKQLVEIRLKSIDTKTGEQRVAVLGGDLYTVLKSWHVFTQATYPHVKTVCYYKGKPMKSNKTAWQTACVRAGLGHWERPDGAEVGNRRYRGALIHDFRRTAVSNMEDAGIPRKVAMAISGHKTDSVYRRYHIVRKADLVEAGRKLLAHHTEEHGSQAAPEFSPEKVFTKCSPTSQMTPKHPGSGRTRQTPSKQRNAASIASK